ncbi:triose-phosphate isomerase [Fluctibacter halophilus]|uniref:triose-phosphate isomerase n=1 Tax=Fluctibacter halophilus TaxID=226011 RepID=UPI002B4BD308|nr:triose-phosphate isomerase [Aestuariibacter halophilus]
MVRLVNISPAFRWAKDAKVNNKRRPLVAGNWKMNGSAGLAESMRSTFATAQLNKVDVAVCPPFVFLHALADANVALGAQTLSEYENGAHTGEISAQMLKALDCQYVIVGHSERRADQHESNGLVADKVAMALAAEVTPIFCVGEPEDIRDSGNLYEYLAAQIDAVVSHVGIDAFEHMVVAYEPIWAIGTGKTASPEQAQDVHRFIREHLAKNNPAVAQGLRILYGGSVKSSNAAELFGQPDVDGGLIGGASLDPEEFLRICQAADS